MTDPQGSLDAALLLTLLLAALAVAGALATIWALQRGQRAERARAEAETRAAAAAARLETLQGIESERDDARAEARSLAERLAASESSAAARAEAAEARTKQLLALKTEFEAQFAALAAQALDRNEQRFLALANETFEKHKSAASGGVETVLKPVQESFALLAQQVESLSRRETENKAAFGAQMQGIAQLMEQSRQATDKLATALRAAPKTRGNWGEQTLRNILELAGLSPYADYSEQTTVTGDDGKLRPDVIIRLPGGGVIVVDAKVALAGYFEAMDAPDDAARGAALKRHAAQVRLHAKRLADQDYSAFVPNAIDIVAMFVPGESFYAAAVEQDPELFEFAVRNKVVIVTPATLVALAKAVAYGWRQEEAHRNAQTIADLGRELYRRLSTFSDKLGGLGGAMETSIKRYNELVGSFDSRVLPQARRFRDLGAGDSHDLAEPTPIETAPRLPAPPAELELTPPPARKRGG
jgi:DNA recombination protein RmuC